jgi:hypothetical protein
MGQCPVCEKVGSMKKHQLVSICSLGVTMSAFLGCASKNNCPPYPVYPQPYQQAYPYNYAGQPGGQPIQPGPMVGQPTMGQPTMGQPTMGQPTMGQPPMGQPVYPAQQFQGQPYYGAPPNSTGTPMIGR